ncbi:MAG: universal stress protein [Chitinophagales bacterium]
MSIYKKIGLAVDNTDMDKSIYNACKKMNNTIFAIEKIYIVTARNLNPIELQYITDHTIYAELEEKFDNALKDDIKDKALKIIGQEFKDKISIEVLTGSPVEETLNFFEKEKIDLFLVGKKKKKRGSGRFAKELLRRSDLPVLMIPEDFNHAWELNKILVPYDFSEFSDKALLKAIEFKKANSNIEKIECYHLLDSPVFDSEMLISTHKIVQMMEQGRKDAFVKKIEELKIKDAPALVIETSINNYSALEIVKRAQKKNFSLIIMGAKGHSAFERFFLGSVTEKVISKDGKLPLLIVN